MTTVAERFVHATAPEYRRPLRSGVHAIAVVSGLLVAWALLAMVALSAPLGFAALGVAACIALLDAAVATPTRIDVDTRGVTLGFWKRDKRYEPKAVVLTHHVPSGRLSLSRRGRRHSLVRFREDDASTALRAFLAAGVEIISR